MNEDLIQKISQQWFLKEPAYFALYCLQQVQQNSNISCPFRVGRGMLEYNPDLIKEMSYIQAEQLMRIEMIRLFLKHPYERQPDGVGRTALALGSDITISDNYNNASTTEKLPLISPHVLDLESGQYYEWYVKRINEMLEQIQDYNPEGDLENVEKQSSKKTVTKKDKLLEAAAETAKDKADLWQEDELKCFEINDLIRNITSWGSLPGNIIELIEASTKAKIDYRQIFQGFRGSILSSKRKLSRMRPNRRNGFEQMGSVREFNTKLLVAVDVSGSISDETLSNFYGVINKMFKYGIKEIDCVQFDCILGEVKNIRKASRKIQICGRGGTSFQPIIDYIEKHQDYDGLIILTDGYAEHPKISDNNQTDILWVCTSEQTYNEHHQWMELQGRACWMIL